VNTIHDVNGGNLQLAGLVRPFSGKKLTNCFNFTKFYLRRTLNAEEFGISNLNEATAREDNVAFRDTFVRSAGFRFDALHVRR
jgi:hypothetical protein